MTESSGHGVSLELRAITKHYGDFAAVDGVDLTVEPGEFMTFLGPSGSGKTTSLDIVGGFIRPDSGSVLVGGEDVTHLPAHRRGIGYVFQHYALFPHLTVFDNVAFALKQRGVPKKQIVTLVSEALDLVRLSGYGRRMPRQLSGGEQQRVALARAVVFKPPVLLMDEPLGALDKKLREWLQLEIRRIHRELGSTFIYVTHDQEEALVLSDRIALFRRGNLEQVGTADSLYDRPASLFVAEFLGDSNVLRGRARANGSGIKLETDHFAVFAPGNREVADGADGVVVVRPERMSIADAEGTAERGNVLPGQVREVLYLGAFHRYLVDVAGGNTVTVRQARGLKVYEPGSPVSVGWAPEDSVLLPADSAP